MGQRMCALLTCAWVLWQTNYMGNQRTGDSVVGAAENLKNCQELAGPVARAVAKEIHGKLDTENVVVTRGDQTFVFRCLPDTIKP
jgi:hypothetical protein